MFVAWQRGHTRLVSRTLPAVCVPAGFYMLPPQDMCYTLVSPEDMLTDVSRIHQYLPLRVSRGVFAYRHTLCVFGAQVGAVQQVVALFSALLHVCH